MDFSYKKIWTITLPVLISLLMQNLIGMTDTAFMGRVGEVELGASALGGIFYLVVYMIGFGFSIGAEIVMARRNGEGEYAQVGNVFYHGVAVLLVIAAVVFSVSYAFAPAILKSFISSEAVYQATVDYTKWRVFGFFFSFVGIMFRAFYMATTKTKILTLNSLVMVGSNMLLNYLLIFGKFGFPAMGIEGAAIASAASEAISLLFFVIYTRSKFDYKKYGLFRKWPMRWSVQKQIFSVSGWTMIQYFLSCGTWMFFFVAIEHLGERSLAVSNLVRNVSTLIYLFVAAFATTGASMVSNIMGTEGGADKVMKLCRRIIKLCAVFTLPFLLLALVYPQVYLYIYTDSAELVASSLPSMRIMLLAYVFGVPGYVYFLAVSGTGNTRAAMWIEISILAVYASYIYITAVRIGTDVSIIWFVESVYNVLLLSICLLYLRHGSWKRKKI